MRKFLLFVLLGLAPVTADAGAPLIHLVQLRKLEVLRCEPLTPENVASVSEFVTAPGRPSRSSGRPSNVAQSVRGYVIEATIKRQRDLAADFVDGRPSTDSGWKSGDGRAASLFFLPRATTAACKTFARGLAVR